MAVSTCNYSALYSPLPIGAIRILKLLPGLPGDGVQCELLPSLLKESDDRYEAISYTWGSPACPATITCNKQPLEIQQNAFHCLQKLRYHSEARYLWVDAICINQADSAEREAQVSIMNQVYLKAKIVTIWLGPSDASSKAVLSFARSLDVTALQTELHAGGFVAGPTIRDATGTLYTAEHVLALSQKTYLLREVDAYKHQIALHLGAFFSRPFFGRVWIQQEVRLGKQVQVYCGEDKLAWPTICALAWIMLPPGPGAYTESVNRVYTEVLTSHLEAVIQIESYRLRKSGWSPYTGNFYQKLGAFRHLGATDFRDKVYSLVNLVYHGTQDIEISYKMPWQVLYLNVAQLAFKCGMVGIIGFAGRSFHKPGSTLPSWMPDFSERRLTDYILLKRSRWRAGQDTPTMYSSVAKRPRSFTPNCTLHILPKALRRHFPAEDDVRR